MITLKQLDRLSICEAPRNDFQRLFPHGAEVTKHNIEVIIDSSKILLECADWAADHLLNNKQRAVYELLQEIKKDVVDNIEEEKARRTNKKFFYYKRMRSFVLFVNKAIKEDECVDKWYHFYVAYNTK